MRGDPRARHRGCPAPAPRRVREGRRPSRSPERRVGKYFRIRKRFFPCRTKTRRLRTVAALRARRLATRPREDQSRLPPSVRARSAPPTETIRAPARARHARARRRPDRKTTPRRGHSGRWTTRGVAARVRRTGTTRSRTHARLFRRPPRRAQVVARDRHRGEARARPGRHGEVRRVLRGLLQRPREALEALSEREERERRCGTRSWTRTRWSATGGGDTSTASEEGAGDEAGARAMRGGRKTRRRGRRRRPARTYFSDDGSAAPSIVKYAAKTTRRAPRSLVRSRHRPSSLLRRGHLQDREARLRGRALLSVRQRAGRRGRSAEDDRRRSRVSSGSPRSRPARARGRCVRRGSRARGGRRARGRGLFVVRAGATDAAPGPRGSYGCSRSPP